MTIGNVIQKGRFIVIYDERGRETARIMAGPNPGDGVQGYTSTNANVRYGRSIISYDERGREISRIMA